AGKKDEQRRQPSRCTRSSERPPRQHETAICNGDPDSVLHPDETVPQRNDNEGQTSRKQPAGIKGAVKVQLWIAGAAMALMPNGYASANGGAHEPAFSNAHYLLPLIRA